MIMPSLPRGCLLPLLIVCCNHLLRIGSVGSWLGMSRFPPLVALLHGALLVRTLILRKVNLSFCDEMAGLGVDSDKYGS